MLEPSVQVLIRCRDLAQCVFEVFWRDLLLLPLNGGDVLGVILMGDVLTSLAICSHNQKPFSWITTVPTASAHIRGVNAWEWPPVAAPCASPDLRRGHLLRCRWRRPRVGTVSEPGPNPTLILLVNFEEP